jgi:hypothetical protein
MIAVSERYSAGAGLGWRWGDARKLGSLGMS